MLYQGSRESRDGAVVRAFASHQCGLGSIPGPGARFSKVPITFWARKAQFYEGKIYLKDTNFVDFLKAKK